LWITPYVDPRLLFCPEDAAKRNYSKYFASIDFSTQREDLESINRIHCGLDSHYSTPAGSPNNITSLKDLGLLTPGELIVLPDDVPRLCVPKSNGKSSQFTNYVSLVTNASHWKYCLYQVAFGSGTMLGEVYLGFKSSKDNLIPAARGQIMEIAFDVLGIFVIAGVIPRNLAVLEMLQAYAPLVRKYNEHIFKHRNIYLHLGYDEIEARRAAIEEFLGYLNKNTPGPHLSHVNSCTVCSLKLDDDMAHKAAACFQLYTLLNEDLTGRIIPYGYAELDKDLAEVFAAGLYGAARCENPHGDSRLDKDLPIWNQLRKLNADDLNITSRVLLGGMLSVLADAEVWRSNLTKLGLSITCDTVADTKVDICVQGERILASMTTTLTGTTQGGRSAVVVPKDIEKIDPLRIKKGSVTFSLYLAERYFRTVAFRVTTYEGSRRIAETRLNWTPEEARNECQLPDTTLRIIYEYQLTDSRG
ncbi:MAG: hypothetical protein ACREBU_18730, partial [Nitrososphaera sp.]